MQPKNHVSIPVLKERSNQELVEGAKRLVGRSRIVTAHLVAHLAEIDARKLHVAEGFSYLGNYCMAVLGMSEAEAKRRSHAAMLAKKYPVILDMLLEGSIHLTTLRIIGKCLTPKNHRTLLNAARGKSNTELEHLAAVLNPKPDVPTVLRKLPERRLENPPSKETMVAEQQAAVHPGAVEAEGRKGQADTVEPEAKAGGESVSVSYGTGEPAVKPGSEELTGVSGLEVRLDGELVQVVASTPKPPRLAQLSAERYSLQITINKEAHDALRELQDLLRHQVPNGNLVTIVQDSILERRDRVKGQKYGHTKRSRKGQGQESWIEETTTAETSVSDRVPVESLIDGDLRAGAPEVKTPRARGMALESAALGGETEHPITGGKTEDTASAPGRFKTRSAGAPGRLVNSRHIPIAVKREVWQRDKGRCAFVGRGGRRCSETGRLEFHHIHAYALGGPATVENIALRCRAHNAYEGVALFGDKEAMRPGTDTGLKRPGALASPAAGRRVGDLLRE